MRYWYLQLQIRCGEYEFYSKSVQKTERKEEFDAEEYARDFYGSEPDEECGAYFFNCGEIAVQVYSLQEITKKEYDVLRKYL